MAPAKRFSFRSHASITDLPASGNAAKRARSASFGNGPPVPGGNVRRDRGCRSLGGRCRHREHDSRDQGCQATGSRILRGLWRVQREPERRHEEQRREGDDRAGDHAVGARPGAEPTILAWLPWRRALRVHARWRRRSRAPDGGNGRVLGRFRWRSEGHVGREPTKDLVAVVANGERKDVDPLQPREVVLERAGRPDRLDPHGQDDPAARARELDLARHVQRPVRALGDQDQHPSAAFDGGEDLLGPRVGARDIIRRHPARVAGRFEQCPELARSAPRPRSCG